MSTTQNHIKRQCSCGKTDADIDNCQLCGEARAAQFPQMDSYIFAALKYAIVEAFFKQQVYYPPGGAYVTYGGQAAELVDRIMKDGQFQVLINQIGNSIMANKEEWKNIAMSKMIPKVEELGANMVHNYDLRDALSSTLNKVALEQAKVAFENDPVLKEKIAKAVSSQKYTVEFDIRIKIVEDRAPQQ